MTTELLIPKGKLYLNFGTGEEYVGNTPTMGLDIAIQNLEHFDGDSGIQEKDDTTLIQVVRTLKFESDNISVNNWARFLIAEASTQTQAATAVVAEALPNAFNGTITQGNWYQLGASSANPSGVREVSAVAVQVGASTKTIVTDYLLDLVLGRVYIVPGGGIAAGAAVTVDYTPAAKTRSQVISSSNIGFQGAAHFIGDNPKGENRDFLFPWMTLTPQGTAQIKSDTPAYMKLGFQLDILKKDSNTAAVYIDGRAY